MNRESTHGFKAFQLLKGVGIEIGAHALSRVGHLN